MPAYQVQSLSQIIAANPISSDPDLAASSIAKIKEIIVELKQTVGCDTCQGYPTGLPDDLRLSRGFWCKYCDLVFYCSAHVAGGWYRRSRHSCAPKPRSEAPVQREARWAREEARELDAQKAIEKAIEETKLGRIVKMLESDCTSIINAQT